MVAGYPRGHEQWPSPRSALKQRGARAGRRRSRKDVLLSFSSTRTHLSAALVLVADVVGIECLRAREFRRDLADHDNVVYRMEKHVRLDACSDIPYK